MNTGMVNYGSALAAGGEEGQGRRKNCGKSGAFGEGCEVL